ncbi:hypothetical protein ZWY2020_025437 [Hordeum vulgare]|nr:hypothetical protein ZWY2020_025437 [Hordeum vulgare]
MALLLRSGKASAGDAVYRAMRSSDKFSPDYLLDYMDVSSLADQVKAAMYVWWCKAMASHDAGEVGPVKWDQGAQRGRASRVESLHQTPLPRSIPSHP